MQKNLDDVARIGERQFVKLSAKDDSWEVRGPNGDEAILIANDPGKLLPMMRVTNRLFRVVEYQVGNYVTNSEPGVKVWDVTGEKSEAKRKVAAAISALCAAGWTDLGIRVDQVMSDVIERLREPAKPTTKFQLLSAWELLREAEKVLVAANNPVLAKMAVLLRDDIDIAMRGGNPVQEPKVAEKPADHDGWVRMMDVHANGKSLTLELVGERWEVGGVGYEYISDAIDLIKNNPHVRIEQIRSYKLAGSKTFDSVAWTGVADKVKPMPASTAELDMRDRHGMAPPKAAEAVVGKPPVNPVPTPSELTTQAVADLTDLACDLDVLKFKNLAEQVRGIRNFVKRGMDGLPETKHEFQPWTLITTPYDRAKNALSEAEKVMGELHLPRHQVLEALRTLEVWNAHGRPGVAEAPKPSLPVRPFDREEYTDEFKGFIDAHDKIALTYPGVAETAQSYRERLLNQFRDIIRVGR